jgi:hypothetical protein
MAQIRIYNQETNRYYNIDFTLQQTVLENSATGDIDVCLVVSTTVPTITGGVFPTYVVRTLSDTPDGYGIATDFNELCQWYYDYIVVTSQLSQSSSSSSSELYSTSSSSSSLDYSTSSSSSSLDYSTSSSSSSSELYSTSSSSSSLDYSTSSSSSSDSTEGL